MSLIKLKCSCTPDVKINHELIEGYYHCLSCDKMKRAWEPRTYSGLIYSLKPHERLTRRIGEEAPEAIRIAFDLQ